MTGASNYPGALDNDVNLGRVLSTDVIVAAHHNNLNDAVQSIEGAVGVRPSSGWPPVGSAADDVYAQIVAVAAEVAGGGSGASAFYPITAPPAAATWGWVQQQGSIKHDVAGGVSLWLTTNPTVGFSLLTLPLPAPPCHAHGWFDMSFCFSGTPFLAFGVRDSASGKLYSFLQYRGGSPYQFGVFQQPSASGASFGSGISGLGIGDTRPWLRYRDDGTDRWWQYSADGYSWCMVLAEPSGTYLVPDQLYIGGWVNGAPECGIRCISLDYGSGLAGS